MHYRVPVTKTYTLVSSVEKFISSSPAGHTAKGHVRMGVKDMTTAATFKAETLSLSGLDADTLPSHINKKGQNIPVTLAFHADPADLTAPALTLTGLATVDAKNDRLASHSGIAHGAAFLPLPCTCSPKADQAYKKFDASNFAASTEDPHGDIPANVYYPHPCLDTTKTALQPAHFHATYTARYNAKLTKEANALANPAAVETLVNSKVPAANK